MSTAPHLSAGTRMDYYVNKYGLWDVKPGDWTEPTGNDGWIITAYAALVSMPNGPLAIRNETLEVTWENIRSNKGLPVMRYPGKQYPPPSRDVILGLVYLGFIDVKTLEKANWNFSPWELPKLNVFELVWELMGLIGKDRNSFWMLDGYEQTGHVAFMVPLQDRAFIYRACGEKVPWIYKMIEAASMLLKPTSDSGKLLSWLKHGKLPEPEVFERYFGKDHPITKAAVDL